MPLQLETLANCDELLDLGIGVVDTLNDLVTESVSSLLSDELPTIPHLNIGSGTSAAETARREYSSDIQIPEDQIWGFSDSDPNGEYCLDMLLVKAPVSSLALSVIIFYDKYYLSMGIIYHIVFMYVRTYVHMYACMFMFKIRYYLPGQKMIKVGLNTKKLNAY